VPSLPELGPGLFARATRFCRYSTQKLASGHADSIPQCGPGFRASGLSQSSTRERLADRIAAGEVPLSTEGGSACNWMYFGRSGWWVLDSFSPPISPISSAGCAPSWRFPAANLVGSLLILVSLYAEWNLPSVVIEVFWIAISVYGLVNRPRAG
jgi:hypothetical protein